MSSQALQCTSAPVVTYESNMDSGLAQVIWANTPTLVMVVSELGSLYRSNDNGVTWQSVTLPTPLRVVWSVDDAADVYYALSSDFLSLFVSRDAGASFVRATATAFLHSTQPSLARLVPQAGTRGRVLAGIGWTEACVECDVTTAAYHPNLYLSVDFGKSWTLVHEYVSPFGVIFAKMGNATAQLLYGTLPTQAGASTLCNDACNAVLATFDATSGAVIGRATLFRNVDAVQHVLWHGTSEAQHDDDAVAIERRADVGDGRVFSLSHDSGRSWITASTPLASQQLDFSVVAADADTGDLITAAEPVGNNDTVTLLTTRFPGSSQFVVALRHVRALSLSALAGRIDVETSEDLNGVIFANSYRIDDENQPDYTCLQSRVSHSFGAQWEPLQASPEDCTAANVTSASDCFVQFYGVTAEDESIGRIYTTAGSHGVWFAPGHIGRCLDLKRTVNRTQLFVSRDAGHTWKSLGSGEQTYEISNYGALLVVADTSAAQTAEFRYSLDYGLTFNTCALSDNKLLVQNVITRVVGNDVDSSTSGFLLYGKRYDNTTSRWQGVLITLSFAAVFPRNCTGIATAGQPSSDYDAWSPHIVDDTDNGCALGARVLFARKKPTVDCLIPLSESLQVSSTRCGCLPTDYQCDFCYSRNRNAFGMPLSGPAPVSCVASSSAVCQAQPNGAPAGECGVGDLTYVPSNGYQRVPNDVCDDTVAGATRFAVAAPMPCPSPVRQCSELKCGECATADNCLWCAQSTLGAVDWSTGTCVDVKNKTDNFCSKPGVFVAYSAWLCSAPPATPPPVNVCTAATRDQANVACADLCANFDLVPEVCPCNVTYTTPERVVCENGCTPKAMSHCADQCLAIGADVIACNCDGTVDQMVGKATCKSINGPAFYPDPSPPARAVAGDGVFAIMFFFGFLIFLFSILVAYCLSKRGGRRGHQQA